MWVAEIAVPRIINASKGNTRVTQCDDRHSALLGSGLYYYCTVVLLGGGAV